MIIYVFDVSFDMSNIKIIHSERKLEINYEIGLIPKIDYNSNT